MKPIKHIWFDLSGTLDVQGPDFEEAHRQLLYDTYAKVVNKPVSDGLMAQYQAIYRKAGTHSAAFASLGLPSDFWMHKYNNLDFEQFSVPRPDVYGTLDHLKDRVPISLFTNATADGIVSTLERLRIQQDWFTHVISGDDVQKRKPDLEGFRLVVQKTALPAEYILYVGDRLSADIRPAHAVGMQACLVWSTSDEADYSFEHFEDLLRLVS